MKFSCRVDVWPKPALLDPQGKAIEGALPAMGWANVSGVRVGKCVKFLVEAQDEAAAVAQVHAMAERLLSNPVIEVFVVRDVTEWEGLTFEDRP